MIGAVWEWCADQFGGYGLEVRGGDGLRSAPVQGGPGHHVFRSGGFLNAALGARSADRGRSAPEYRADNLGVRPARVLD